MPRLARSDEFKRLVGKRLRMARKALNLTQPAAADSSGVGSSTWANYETGQRLADPWALERFCRYYGVTMDWIYLGNAGGLPRDLWEKMLSPSRHLPSRK